MNKAPLLNFLSLFSSTATLICCALPVLLVALGFGVVVATTVSTFPWLMTLSRQKHWVFLGAFLILTANYALVYRKTKTRSCNVGTSCHTQSAVSRTTRAVYWISWGLYGVAFFVAYLSVPVMKFLAI